MFIGVGFFVCIGVIIYAYVKGRYDGYDKGYEHGVEEGLKIAKDVQDKG